jgi:hypothetical protein
MSYRSLRRLPRLIRCCWYPTKRPQILQYADRQPDRSYRSGLAFQFAGSLCGPQEATAAGTTSSWSSMTKVSTATGVGARQAACSLANTSVGVVVMVVTITLAYFCTRPLSALSGQQKRTRFWSLMGMFTYR